MADPFTLTVAAAALGEYLWDRCKSSLDSGFKDAAGKALKKLAGRLTDEGLPVNRTLQDASRKALSDTARALSMALAQTLEPRKTLVDAISAHFREGKWFEKPLFEQFSSPERDWVEALETASENVDSFLRVDANFFEDRGDLIALVRPGEMDEVEQRLRRRFEQWLDHEVQRGTRPAGIDEFLRLGWPVTPQGASVRLSMGLIVSSSAHRLKKTRQSSGFSSLMSRCAQPRQSHSSRIVSLRAKTSHASSTGIPPRLLTPWPMCMRVYKSWPVIDHRRSRRPTTAPTFINTTVISTLKRSLATNSYIATSISASLHPTRRS